MSFPSRAALPLLFLAALSAAPSAQACAPSGWSQYFASLPDCVVVESGPETRWPDTGEGADSANWYDTADLQDGIDIFNGCEEALTFTVLEPKGLEVPSPIPPGGSSTIPVEYAPTRDVYIRLDWHLGDERGLIYLRYDFNPCGPVVGCNTVGVLRAPAGVAGMLALGLWAVGWRRRDGDDPLA